MDNLRGIFLMVVAMAAFAAEDALIKAGTSVMPTSQLILTVGLMGTVILLLVCRMQRMALLTRDLAHPAVIARNTMDTVGVVFFVTALSVVPLTTLAALIQLTPLSMTLCAALLLRETVGWRRWSAVIVGLIGMLLIIRPGMDSFDMETLLAVGAVLCLTGRDLATRYVPKGLPNLQLTTYGFATMIPAGLILAPMAGAYVTPTAGQWGMLLAIMTLALVGYYAVTAAMRLGEVSVVSPFRYTRLLLAMLLGVVFFGERPDALTLVGAGLILAAGLYTLAREARARRG